MLTLEEGIMTEEKTPKKALKLELKIDDAVAGGTYANLCIINHSDSEFVADFAFVQPGRPKAKVSNRIVLSPKNAKRMMLLLQNQVKVFEKRFGEIDVRNAPPIEMIPHDEMN